MDEYWDEEDYTDFIENIDRQEKNAEQILSPKATRAREIIMDAREPYWTEWKQKTETRRQLEQESIAVKKQITKEDRSFYDRFVLLSAKIKILDDQILELEIKQKNATTKALRDAGLKAM